MVVELDPSSAERNGHLVWHRADSNGRAVESGVYFLVIRTGGVTETHRVSIVR